MARYFFSLILLGAVLFSTAQDRKIPQPDLPGDLLMDIGFNYWSSDDDTLKNWGSKSLGIYYNKRYKISNKLSFYPAVGLSFEKYALKKNYHYATDIDNNIVIDSTIALIKRNKLAVTYVEVPLEFRFHPQGTIDGEGFFVGAGVIGSLRMGSHTKLRYVLDDDKRKEKLSDDFGLNDIRYGYQIRVGWKNVHFFYKQYLSEVYGNPQKKVDPDDLTNPEGNGQLFHPRAFTFGINFSGF